MNGDVFGVLLAGGRGKRLWPLSRRSLPKPFLKIGHHKSLFELSLSALTDIIYRKNIIVVTNGYVAKLINKIPKRNIIIEPASKNTAVAVGLAAIHIFRRNPESVMVVQSTDHYIKKRNLYRRILNMAINFVKKGGRYELCLVGVRPKNKSIDFGYIKKGLKVYKDIYEVQRFIEKPNSSSARWMLKSHKFLWNAGIFVWKTKSILRHIEKHSPVLHRELKLVSGSIGTKSYRKFLISAYRKIKDISIDYLIFEKCKSLYCIEAMFDWYDLGNWDNISQILPKDKNRNTTFGKSVLVDVENSLIFNEDGHIIAAAGIKDMVIIHTKDATLLCNKRYANRLKKLVEKVERLDRTLA